MTEITNLKEKTVKGVQWSFINKFGTQILAILPSIVLARLITPEEFGLVAMSGVFSGLAYILSDGGFGTALFQKKDADHLDYCSVFYFNIALSTIVYILFFFIAPYCADFFGMPEITWIMRVSLLSLVINPIGTLHGLKFRKSLDFRKPAIRNIFVQLISSIVAIVIAFLSFGYWALVIQGVLQTTLGCIANWMMCPWRPTLDFSFFRLKSMLGFGSRMFATLLVDYGFGKSYDTVIGKFYSPSTLSFYNRACSTANMFSDTIVGVINGVAYPALVQIQDDKDRLKYNTLRFLRVATLCVFVILSYLFVLAEPLFHFMYSSRWDAAIPLFRIVCIWGGLKCISSILLNVIEAIGNSSAILKNSIVHKICIVVAIVVFWDKGIEYLLLGQLLATVIQLLYFTYYTKIDIAVDLYSIVKNILPQFLICILLSIIVYYADNLLGKCLSFFELKEAIEGIIRISVGLLFCLSLVVYICRLIKNHAYKDLFDIIKTTSNNKYIQKIINILSI